MRREFIKTNIFDEDWKKAGLNDDDLLVLENTLLENPKVGKVIPGLSGGRKLRFAASGRGKSGGVRVVYLDIEAREHLYLLLAYPKNVREDMNSVQKNALCKIIAKIREE